MTEYKEYIHTKGNYNDIGLRLLHKLFGIQHLHYGYFENLKPGTDTAPAAQDAYVRKILSYLPAEGVAQILDVGCGTGGVAKELVKRGYSVTCLAPDPFLVAKAGEATEGKARTLVSRYEHLSEADVPAGCVDLILMSESCQYVHPVPAFEKHRVFLKPGGYVLIADFFRIKAPDERNPSKSGHQLEIFLDYAKEYGFTLVGEEDITPHVAPTMDIYQGVIDRYVFPVVEAAIELLQRAYPLAYRTLKWLLGKKILKIKDKYSKQGGDLFSEYKRYQIFLFRRN